MSLLQETESDASSSRGWILTAVFLGLAAGAAYLFIFRAADGDGTADDTPARVAASPMAAVDPPAPEPEPEPTPEVPAPVATESEPASPAPAVEAPAPVVLRVTSDVDGADVFVDREFVGKTPFESGAISPGPHRVNVSAPGYEGFSDDIEIDDGVTVLDATFKRVSLDQRVAVVHKHRFGDCAGDLVATLEGLHYQTDDDDTFAVTLEALEEFSVDYLEHNLRLKIVGGRTYNFTDGEPNADKLFVFHRAVEQVREQLAAGRDQ